MIKYSNYKVIIAVKSKDKLPDWGLGEGVLGYQEVSYPIDTPDFLIADSLNEISDKLTKELIEIKYEKIDEE